MGPPKEKKTKAAIAAAAAAGGSSKKKKKWNSGKVKEKTNNAFYFDEATYEKLLSDVPNSRLITVATISDKLRVNGSLARAAIRDLDLKVLSRKFLHIMLNFCILMLKNKKSLKPQLLNSY